MDQGQGRGEAAQTPLPPIHGLLPNSLNEWRGRIAAAVVLPGCTMRCPFCHGWRYLEPGEDTPEIPLSRVEDLLQAERGWIDGVVVSGGEPTIHPGLPRLIAWLRGFGVEIKVHTNGTRPDMITTLLERGLVDCLALDYKAPLDARLEKVAGVPVDLDAVRRSFALVAESDIEREYHTTICPALLSPDDLREMAASLHPDGVWFLQQYGPGDVLAPDVAGVDRMPDGELIALADELELIRPGIEVMGVRHIAVRKKDIW